MISEPWGVIMPPLLPLMIPAWSSANLRLMTSIPTNSGWQLQMATLINDSGRIVDIGLHNGMAEWFLMDFNAGSVDTLPPVIAGPDHVTVSLDANCQATLPNLLSLFTITDNCNPA